MNTTTTHISAEAPPSALARSANAGLPRPHGQRSTPDSLLGADLPLLAIVPFGLPSVLLLGGWVFLALALAGPFLFLVTVALATAIVVALAVAVIGVPYLLVRGLRAYWVRRSRRHRDRDLVDHRPPSHRRAAIQVHTNPQAALIRD